MLGRMAYPGAGVDGRYDVDGLLAREGGPYWQSDGIRVAGVTAMGLGMVAAALFLLLRTLVLRSRHAAARSFFVLPLFVFVTIFM